jgi:hypothetical protein
VIKNPAPPLQPAGFFLTGIFAGQRGFQSGKSPVNFLHRDAVFKVIIAESVGR